MILFSRYMYNDVSRSAGQENKYYFKLNGNNKRKKCEHKFELW